MSDKEDKSVDILGLKPFGEAINTVAKGTMDGIGAFLGRICLPAAEEFGLLLRDKISYYRIANLSKVVDKAKKRIGDFGKEASGDMSPKLLKEIVEESSWSKMLKTKLLALPSLDLPRSALLHRNCFC